MANGVRLVDGQFSWSQGVNSDAPRTKASSFVPDGVKHNQTAWCINGNMRGGPIGQRPTLQPLVGDAPWSGIFQGGWLYQPDFTDPILIFVIGGRVYRVRVDTDNSVTDISALYATGSDDLTMPLVEQCHFTQSEMFLIIQAGDFKTLPLFYDFGVEGIRPESLRRSNGLVFPGVSSSQNEIPSAGPMDYYAQRTWYAFGRGYVGSDIVDNTSSGSSAFDFRDSVLKLTENPVAYGGDAFGVPTVAGNIRALAHASNIDSSLGDAQLFVFTRRAVYSCVAPITRTDWTATTLNLMPLQKLILNKGGSYGDRCIVPVNGDLFFPSPPDGNIRSIQATLRYQQQWGYVPLSNNINRVLNFNNRALLHGTTGILFDNRLLMSQMPLLTPAGVASQSIAPLDFDIISTLEERKPPAWEGVYDFSGGPLILQMWEGDFGGRERAFTAAWSESNSRIEVWEIRGDLRFDNIAGGGGGTRVTRVIEFPAYTFDSPLSLKELDSAEFWFDKILGTVDCEAFYRPDSTACWVPWTAFKLCAAKDCTEDPDDPCTDNGYPKEPWCEQDAIPVVLGRPPVPRCEPNAASRPRPSNLGYQFQVKLVTKGWCRLRGMLLYAVHREKAPYAGIACAPVPSKL